MLTEGTVEFKNTRENVSNVKELTKIISTAFSSPGLI